jgi:hypothetical protein
MTPVFLPRYQEALKLPLSPCWSPSQGIPHKGQAPDRVTPWIASGLLHAQVGLWCAFQQASPRPLLAVFTIKLPTETPWDLFPSVHGGGHTTQLVWSCKTTSPAEYKHSTYKHLWSRGMQTSLATRPKSRASTYEHGLTNISTSQRTYANYQMIFMLYACGEHKWGVATLPIFPQLPLYPNGWLGSLL